MSAVRTGPENAWSDFPDLVRRALHRVPAIRLPDEECERRAAVTLLLSPDPDAAGSGPAPNSILDDSVSALFVLRASHDGDPWSGQVGLPGGRVEDGDADLIDTARRETFEETAVDLGREAFLGRLHELHPRSVHLPSIGVAPFVAWLPDRPTIRENHELAGHIWVPLRTLIAPENRSTLILADRPDREFQTIEHAGAVIWGLTHAAVQDFLSRVAPPQ
ncbi:MAG: CoA pyrophosphatase [marine benthic group bacterium]|nr:CoA pyrophosphatase [Gemmatimonadota bacterium]MCL7961816.1 CoA pyrophosphatase [Candidatus Carthagonibacter metallireducens]MCL7937637.1 CoA pyrophosphatase [Gemmatimonadota bacterium]MCL7957648.1 CoA pyrophosphatase [Gemmatimonadota bacterium]MCL7964824.1 CoA pyrophosphatase [Gemmatimonadota bacterium]